MGAKTMVKAYELLYDIEVSLRNDAEWIMMKRHDPL